MVEIKKLNSFERILIQIFSVPEENLVESIALLDEADDDLFHPIKDDNKHGVVVYDSKKIAP